MVGANGAGGGLTPGLWYFYDRNTSDAFSGANMYFTDVPLVPGVTYSFVIEVNPATASYAASITSSAGSDSASNLGFRNGAVGGAGDYLLFGGTTSEAGENLGFSYDNVFIVPEPSAVLLAGLTELLGLRRKRIS